MNYSFIICAGEEDGLAVRRFIGPVVQALRGCPFRKDAVGAALAVFLQEEYFGDVTKGEVLETLFGTA